MAKFKGKGVVVAGLVVGAASFLSKKENRDKAMNYLDQLKKNANSSYKGVSNIQKSMDEFLNAETDTKNDKIAGFMAMSPNAKEEPVKETLEDIASTAGQAVDSVLEGNHMIDEGAQTTVSHYNEEQSKQDYR